MTILAEKTSSDNFFKLLFQLLIFLLPTQVGLHFWPNSAYVFGIRVDYLSPTIYLSDILLISLFVYWLFREKSSLFKTHLAKNNLWLLPLLLFVFLNLHFSSFKYVTLFKWLKILELAIFAFLVINYKKLDIKRMVVYPLILSLFFFAIIGLAQFLIGGALTGPFYFLGERAFNKFTPGIATFRILEKTFLRLYSTFSHPNSLAGYLAASLPFLFIQGFFKQSLFRKILLCFLLLILFLTYSWGSFLSLVVAGLFHFFSRKTNFFPKLVFGYLASLVLLSLLMPVVANETTNYFDKLPEEVEKRLSLAVVSGKFFSTSPFWGIGLNSFIPNIPKVVLLKGPFWFLQPVHNIFLLVVSETGIFGLIIFVLLLVKTFLNLLKRQKQALLLSLVIVLTTGFFDHYWLTLQQNMLFFSLLFGLSLRNDGWKEFK